VKIRLFFLIIISTCFIYTVLPISNINAKLIVLSPQQMLASADLIIIADVAFQREKEEGLSTLLEVAGIIKGTYNETALSIFQDRHPLYGYLNKLPSEGRVFVLLRKSKHGYEPVGDLHAIGKMSGLSILSVNGSNDDKYVKPYQRYLAEHLKQPLRETGGFIGWGMGTIVLAAALGLLVLLNVYYFFFKPRK
jgi:hypothetical protein